MNSQTAFGVTVAGEWSNGKRILKYHIMILLQFLQFPTVPYSGYNDCGLFLKGPQTTSTSYGGNCSIWQDSSTWNQTVKDGVQEFSLATMDALQDWFFWTWKVRIFHFVCCQFSLLSLTMKHFFHYF